MSDLIRRSELLAEYDRQHEGEPGRARNLIADAPAVDAVEVRHGYWDDSGRYEFADGKTAIRCSVCGACITEEEYVNYFWYYCPICGAKMDRGKDDATD